MLRSLGIALLCLVALAPSRVEAEAPVLIVKQGDALSSIAKRAGVSVEQIKNWIEMDGGDAEKTARWMARKLKIAGIKECRAIIAEALSN